MRPATRLGPSLASVSQKSTVRPGFVCLQCRHRSVLASQKGAVSTSVPISPQRHASSSSTSSSKSWTEKIRRKMWGTENPPGAEDPYGGPSKLEQRRDNRKKDLVAVAEGAPDAETVLPDDGASNYVPATTWDGLEHIGGASGWWEEAWDQEHPFYGFMAPSKMTSREEIEAAVRRAVIEVFTLQDAERQLADAVNALDDKVIPDFENVTISQSDDGSVVLNFLDTHVREDILQSTDLSRRGPAEEVMETQDEYEAASTKGITEVDAVHATPVGQIMPEKESTAQQTGEFHPPASTSAESGWGDVSIRDTDLKFAVLKRVMQLTGTRIPDHAIEDINTAKALIGHLVKKPKPKKLAESLLVNEKLTALPNLQIFDRRYTPIDKEKEVGRWKVIEKELERRGLPITGTA